MEPTARAHEILKHLTPALDAMSTALSLTTDFDPSVSKMTFRIGLTDDVEFGLLPAMLKAIREEAPGVVIVVKHVDYLNISEVLMSGDITVGVCLTRELPANAKRKTLRNVQPRLVRADKPAGPMSLDEYCSRPHVVVSHVASVSSFADEWLTALGRKRQVVLSVPQFATLPALMAGTDMISGLSDYAAKAMSALGLLYDEPLPFPTPGLDLSMTWLSVMDSDPAERWLRSRIEAFMGERQEAPALAE